MLAPFSAVVCTPGASTPAGRCSKRRQVLSNATEEVLTYMDPLDRGRRKNIHAGLKNVFQECASFGGLSATQPQDRCVSASRSTTTRYCTPHTEEGPGSSLRAHLAALKIAVITEDLPKVWRRNALWHLPVEERSWVEATLAGPRTSLKLRRCRPMRHGAGVPYLKRHSCLTFCGLGREGPAAPTKCLRTVRFTLLGAWFSDNEGQERAECWTSPCKMCHPSDDHSTIVTCIHNKRWNWMKARPPFFWRSLFASSPQGRSHRSHVWDHHSLTDLLDTTQPNPSLTSGGLGPPTMPLQFLMHQRTHFGLLFLPCARKVRPALL